MTTKIKSSNIIDDAISEEHLDVTAITGNSEISASAAADDILLIYDASSGTIKKIQASRVGMQNPVVSSVSPTNVKSGDLSGNHTFVITGTRFDSTATAKLKKTGGADLAFSSVTRNSSTQLTCVIAKSALLTADEPFDVVVTTESGLLSGTLADQITVDASPIFVTSTGSIGSVLESVAGSFSVNATDPESTGVVTFELQSGALPTGFTLTNTAAEGGTAIIAGTHGAVSANTTYNFVLRAVDNASNTTSRAFAITIQNDPVTTSFTASGTFAVAAGASVYDVLVVAGAGGGQSQGPHPTHRSGSGGGGAGGLVFMPDYPVTPGGTITVTVGTGYQGNGAAGQDSIFGSPGDPGLGQGGALSAKGGGGGGDAYQNPCGHQNGRPGGSGGGSSGGTVGPATQPTQSGNSGAYGFGNAGAPGSPGNGGGGGGAGAAGNGGQGGAGKAYTITDGTTSVYYAGGGGGGPSGQGGQGGGGNGGFFSGQANKGGGAGGSSGLGQGGSIGGKGIVIVRG